MSEFQHVEFRAVDRPLNDQELAFAELQSSRADVSRWGLSVDYHYSCFRGDVDRLLRQGYDVFLRYANYGEREIRIRLPHGLPFRKSLFSKYIDGTQLSWIKDPKGPGGILSLCPLFELGEQGEVWEFDAFLAAVIQIRERLIGGDLRALYLLWLCAVCDKENDPDEIVEPPVPHGISDLFNDFDNLSEFYGLNPLLLSAAGMDVEAAPSDQAGVNRVQSWAETIEPQRAKELLVQLVTSDALTLKRNLLAEIRDSQSPKNWPSTNLKRTYAELLHQAEFLKKEADAKAKSKAEAQAKRDAKKAEADRQLKIKEMIKDPQKWLRTAEKLVNQRGTDNYKAAADILSDLREAIGGEKGEKMARRKAAQLAAKNPTLNILKSSLRKRGLLS